MVTDAALLRLVGWNQRVLDVGGTEGLARALAERGCQVVSLAADPAVAEDAAQWSERVIVGDLDELEAGAEVGDSRFDVVVIGDVLSHVTAPQATLRWLGRLLAPGGYLVASVPNVAHAQLRMALVAGSFPFSELGLDHGTPRRFFTRASLLQLLEAAELTPLHVEAVEPTLDETGLANGAGAVDDDELAEFVAAQPDAEAQRFVAVAAPPPLRGAIPELIASLSRDRADLARQLAELSRRPASCAERPPAGLSGRSVIDLYVTEAPSPQTAVDIFAGDWTSQLPEGIADTGAQRADLFDDPRARWAIEEMGGVTGAKVLELGPLEGGHSYMLVRAGATSVMSIEANTRAYLKCLIVKEVLGLDRVRFHCGDFIAYLRTTRDTFDVCFASGVLYHMQNPAELIALAAKVSDRLYIWSHYFDPSMTELTNLTWRFPSSTPAEHLGFRHTLHRHVYGDALAWSGFCGAGSAASNWMERDEILACLDHFGWNLQAIGWHEPGHPNGPAFALVAAKRPDC